MNKFSWPEEPTLKAFPIAPPGFAFIIVAALVTLLFALTGSFLFTFLGVCITLFICWFFRDPDRTIEIAEGAFSSPADGKIIFTGDVETNPYFEGPCKKISIFMSVMNVHVNRIPLDGKIIDTHYFPGKFVNASFDKASEDNERNAIIIETKSGKKIATVQIAGLIARRIICSLKTGDIVQRGKRYGMICFGSRLDLYLPIETKIKVSNGDKVQAGTSILGFLDD